LGRAIRTGFLLRYIADVELRSSIGVAMNKSEQFNAFLDWVSFGRDVINTNDRDAQRKRIKFNHLAANLVMFETVADLTRALRQLRTEGIEVPVEVLQHISPFVREQINCFGEYRLNLEAAVEPLEYELGVAVK
jgi:TnpA family transposase